MQHWNSVALHHRVWWDIDLVKVAEGKLCVTALAGCASSGAHCAVKEQLGSGIPHHCQALAADVYNTLYHVVDQNMLLDWGDSKMEEYHRP